MRKLPLILILSFAFIFEALADGVTEFTINPATGFTISTSGSYRLAADVTVASAAIPAITISVSNVTLDLAGHNIGGPTNSGRGINSTGGRVVVFNGRISGFGNWGIAAGPETTVHDVVVQGCNRLGSSGGIQVGLNSVIENCTIVGNNPADTLTEGIRAGSNSRIVRNLVDGNTSPNDDVIGIVAASGCEIVDNTVSNQSTSGGNIVGILGDTRCLIRGNSVVNNLQLGAGDATGIQAGAGSRVDRNVVTGNGTGSGPAGNVTGIFAVQSSISNNDCHGHAPNGGGGIGRGIIGDTGCLIVGNRCDSNSGVGAGTGAGIEVNTNCWVARNECRSSAGFRAWGIRVTGAGNLVSSNSTQSNATAGLVFVGAANNRAEMNRSRETAPFDTTNGVNPASLGAGDLANIAY